MTNARFAVLEIADGEWVTWVSYVSLAEALDHLTTMPLAPARSAAVYRCNGRDIERQIPIATRYGQAL